MNTFFVWCNSLGLAAHESTKGIVKSYEVARVIPEGLEDPLLAAKRAGREHDTFWLRGQKQRPAAGGWGPDQLVVT